MLSEIDIENLEWARRFMNGYEKKKPNYKIYCRICEEWHIPPECTVEYSSN